MAKNSPEQDRPWEDTYEPEASEADVAEPEASEAALTEPEESEAALAEPEAAQADIFEPEAEPEHNPLAPAFQRLREGRGKETADLYHDIVKPAETPLVTHVNRGKRHDEHGRHEAAIEEFLAAEKVDPENAENLTHLAMAYGALGRFGEADAVIERALRLDPANVQVRVGEAILAFRKGLYGAAEVQLKGICNRNPSHGPAHFYRGEALNRLGRVDEALQTMERTIQLQPRNWRAYHTLGMLFDRKDEPERASEMYRCARELNRL